MSTPRLNDMTEEQEILFREHIRRFQQFEAQRIANVEQRKRPEIGYGTLFDKGDEPYDYTLTVDLFLPDRDDTSSIVELESMVEEAVKVWLMLHAPKGTKTSLVDVIED